MKALTLTAEMALAAILGYKTETRRPLNPQPKHAQYYEWCGKVIRNAEHRMWCWKTLVLDNIWDFPDGNARKILAEHCAPFGLPGTELWLREPGTVVAASYPESPGGRHGRVKVKYLANNFVSEWIDLPERFFLLPRYTPDDLPSWARKMHGIPNGIFRESARFMTVVMDVRVERLQEITRESIRAEGFTLPPSPRFTPGKFSELHQEFAHTWDRIYGKRPGLAWSDDPWVSVTKFMPMEAI